jgi:lipopolysaccharide/colanic/teichoic acid biosynthesis glycosyltransferase
VKNALSPCERILKRTLDVTLAAVLLLATGWIILAAWIAASISTGQNGMFLQERIGRYGRPFKVIKIRTMRPAAPGESATHVTTSRDPRITPLGAWLRRTKIDELPQILNVLLGQMSFVGPRPDMAGFADQLQGEDRAVLNLRAGITGPATLLFRNEEELLAGQTDPEAYNREVIWPRKVAINLDYIRTYSIWKDIRYIMQTAIGH